MTTHLQVYLFGTFRLYRDGELISPKDWHTRQARQLFKLLLGERGRIVPASRLTSLLWPEYAEHAHKTLRSAISALRDVLEPGRDPRQPSRFVPRGREGYRLTFPPECDVWIDTHEFERLLERALAADAPTPETQRSLEAALALYTGDYLAEDEEASWTLAERRRLRDCYFSGVMRQVEWLGQAGRYNEAIAAGEQAIERDPCREPLYRLIMQYQAQLGDYAAALQTFERCRQALASLLGADPSPQTLELHATIVQGRAAAHAGNGARTTGAGARAAAIAGVVKRSARPAPPFIGRAAELDWLMRRLNEARERSGRAKLVTLVGEAGVGKTSLLRRFLRQARAQGSATLTATCQILEQDMAFAPIGALLKNRLDLNNDEQLAALPRAALARVATLLPELAQRFSDLPAAPAVAPEQAYSLLVAALVDLFLALAEQQPLILAFDDFQWADESTILVVNRLIHQAGRGQGRRSGGQELANGRPVGGDGRATGGSGRLHDGGDGRPQNDGGGKLSSLLVVVAYRPEDVTENRRLSTLLHALGREKRLQALNLARFTPGEVAEYLQVHKAAPPLSAEQLYQATRGNALFLSEAVRTLQDQQRVETSDRAEEDVAEALLRSQQIRDVVLARVERLPARARELLELAATIGHPCAPDILRQTLEPEDYQALEVLLQRGFLIETNAAPGATLQLAPSHEVIGQIVYAHCSALKQTRLHREVAANMERCFAARPEPHAAEIAYHYSRAGAGCEEQALRYHLLAADFARRTFSYRQALTHYTAARRLVEALQIGEAEREEWLGRIYRGQALAYEALLDWQGIQESYQQLSTWAATRQDLTLAQSSAQRIVVTRSLMGHLSEALAMGRAYIARQQAESTTTQSLAPETRESLRLLEDMTQRWTLLLTLDELEGFPNGKTYTGFAPFYPAPPPAVANWERAVQVLEDSQAALALTTYGWALLLQGQNAEAEGCLLQALKASEATDQVTCWIHASMYLSRVYSLYGEHRRSFEMFARCLERCDEVAEAAWVSTWPQLNEAYFLLTHGYIDQAETILVYQQKQLARLDLPAYRYSAQIGLGLVALERGQLERAQELLQDALSQKRSLYIEAYVLAELGLAEIAHSRGATAEALAVQQSMLTFCGERSLLELYSVSAFALARLCLESALPQKQNVVRLLKDLCRLTTDAGYADIVKECRQLLTELR